MQWDLWFPNKNSQNNLTLFSFSFFFFFFFFLIYISLKTIPKGRRSIKKVNSVLNRPVRPEFVVLVPALVQKQVVHSGLNTSLTGSFQLYQRFISDFGQQIHTGLKQNSSISRQNVEREREKSVVDPFSMSYVLQSSRNRKRDVEHLFRSDLCRGKRR